MASLLGVNIGFLRRGKELTLLEGITPTYALNLQGRHYSLSSGYAVSAFREIVNSRLYENLNIFLPNLPLFRISYTRQSTRDTEGENRTDSTGSDLQLEIEDDIGPFHLRVNRRENSLRSLVRAPQYDLKSFDTSGDIDFRYSYRQLFSFTGRYGLGQLRTERETTGELQGNTRDFSLDVRISPVSTIALFGTTIGRQEKRTDEKRKFSSDFLTNRLQLMLQPLDGIFLNLIYSKDDTFQDEENVYSNESRGLVINIEPWRYLTFSGNFTIYDFQGQEKELSTLQRNTYDVRAILIPGLQISSRLDLSRSEDFIGGIRNDIDNVTTTLEATPTMNLRTELSYDWQKLNRRLRTITDETVQQRVTFVVDYSFFRMLDFNFRFSKDILSEREGGATSLNYGLNYLRHASYANIRYSRSSSAARISVLQPEIQLTTRTLTIELNQRVNRDTDLNFGYENQLGDRAFGYQGTSKISFRVHVRF